MTGAKAIKVTLVRARAIDPTVNKVAKTLSENGRILYKKLLAHGEFTLYQFRY